MTTLAWLPARITRSMFSSERTVRVRHLDGYACVFVPVDSVNERDGTVRVHVVWRGRTWELLQLPTLDDPKNIVMRRGVAREVVT